MKNEVPMLQRIRDTLQRRINLIHRLDRMSLILTIVRRHYGTITRGEENLRVDD